MSWAEFRIRLYAYRRQDKDSWFKLREVAWASIIGSHLDPKKLPKSKERFMPLDDGVVKLDSRKAEAFRIAHEKYLIEVEKANGKS